MLSLNKLLNNAIFFSFEARGLNRFCPLGFLFLFLIACIISPRAKKFNKKQSFFVKFLFAELSDFYLHEVCRAQARYFARILHVFCANICAIATLSAQNLSAQNMHIPRSAQNMHTFFTLSAQTMYNILHSDSAEHIRDYRADFKSTVLFGLFFAITNHRVRKRAKAVARKSFAAHRRIEIAT